MKERLFYSLILLILCFLIGRTISECTDSTDCSPPLSTLQSTVNCTIPNCISCLASFCSICSYPYVLNSQQTQCITCSIPNCLTCSQTNKCFVCQSGYQVNSDENQCVICSISGCMRCQSNNICSACYPTFMLNQTENQCTPCQYPCQTCTAGNPFNCLSCIPPFSILPSTQGICYTCSVNCKKCNLQLFCLECNQLFELNTNTGSCIRICPDIFCLQCFSTINSCNLCVSGYAPVEGVCTPCSGYPSCVSCNPSTLSCTACNQGFYLQNQQCLSCQDVNCATCNQNGCILYKQSSGLTAVVIKGVIQPYVCPPPCLKCSHISLNLCLKCAIGYTLTSNSTCIKCAAGCMTCNPANASNCSSCYPNLFYNNGVCSGCNKNSNCLACNPNNNSQCVTCPYGYLMNSLFSPSCQKNTNTNNGCRNYILQSFSDGFQYYKCNSCLDSFVLIQNLCYPCISHCLKCSYQQIYFCSQCVHGYYLNQTNSQCYQCSASNCANCTSDGVCHQCFPQYILNQNFKCQLKCKLPCYTCSGNSPQVCLSCIAGYTLSVSQCNPTTFCPGGCSICPMGYYVTGDFCQLCSLNCQYCSSQIFCLSCFNGYFLNNGQCNQCSSECGQCTSSTICFSCSSGYFLSDQQLSCSKCQFPCLQCLSPVRCLSCLSGFTFDGNTCISFLNLGFNISLQSDSIPFTFSIYMVYQNILEYVQKYNAPTSSSYISYNYTMLNLTGNISLGQLNTDDLPSYYQQILNYQYTLENDIDFTINNGQVLIWSFLINGGTIPSTLDNNSPNIGMILGILIPITFILLCSAWQVFKSFKIQQSVVDINNIQTVQMREVIIIR